MSSQNTVLFSGIKKTFQKTTVVAGLSRGPPDAVSACAGAAAAAGGGRDRSPRGAQALLGAVRDHRLERIEPSSPRDSGSVGPIGLA